MPESITKQERQALLEPFGLAALIGEPPELPDDLGREARISPDDEQWAPHFVKVPVRDVEHLKQLVGVPSELAAQELRKGGDYSELVSEAEGGDLLSQARQVLFGDWKGSMSKGGNADAVSEFMLKAAGELPVFAGRNLIVKDGQQVTLSGAPTFYFDAIEVHGSGEIRTEGQIKLIANSVEHIE